MKRTIFIARCLLAVCALNISITVPAGRKLRLK
jgi:hypothetical protein